MTPLVSVLVSIYRPNESFLREQLDSIGMQTYENIEVIVYNDDPEDSDRSDEIYRLLSPRVKQVRYVHGEKNLGYSAAFEKLVGLARGTYIAFCDQDDIWLPNRIERGVNELESGYVLAVCDRSIIDGSGRIIERSYRDAHPREAECNWNSGDDITAHAAFSCYAIGMATMVRADVALRLIPFPKGSAHDFWLALGASQLGRCAYIDEPLVQYRRHGNNVSSLFSGIASKKDWHEKRVRPKYELACRFCELFPHARHGEEIMAFARARLDHDASGLIRYGYLNRRLALLELSLCIMPDWLFRYIVGLARSTRI